MQREVSISASRNRAPRNHRPFARNVPSHFRRDHANVPLRELRASDLHFDSAVAPTSRGLVRKLVHEFNTSINGTSVTLSLNGSGSHERSQLRGRRFDLIVPVPLHPARERERGFNQATLLAELLSGRIAVPLRFVLERIRYTTTQTAYDRAERMENLHNAFRLRKKMNVRELRVLLIDDVLTTGSTLSECARILKVAGAISVHAATAARA